jgi:hypothetical protein
MFRRLRTWIFEQTYDFFCQFRVWLFLTYFTIFLKNKLGCVSRIVARQRLSKDVPAAMNTHRKKLLDALFSTRSLSYHMKVGYYLFPQLIVVLPALKVAVAWSWPHTSVQYSGLDYVECYLLAHCTPLRRCVWDKCASTFLFWIALSPSFITMSERSSVRITYVRSFMGYDYSYACAVISWVHGYVASQVRSCGNISMLKFGWYKCTHASWCTVLILTRRLM